ncbi:MAG: tetratricopeptide repeat protein, partial [Planctomycetota bacterium]
ALVSLISKGFEPELMKTLISIMIHYGSPGPVTALADMERYGERLWDLAPHAEGVCYAFNILAISFEEAGEEEKALLWRERCDIATPYRIFGGVSPQMEWVGVFLVMSLAVGIGFWTLLFVKGVRSFGAIWWSEKIGIRMYNPFAYWTKGEIVGFILLSLAGSYAANRAMGGAAALGRIAAAPLSVLGGTMGTPDSVVFLERSLGATERRFLHGFALQSEGERDEAEAVYRKLGTARALNNLGVIAHRRGDEKTAKKFFAQALEKDPELPEANFNLGRPASGPRIERMKKYSIPPPLTALPTREHWREVTAARTTPFLGPGAFSAYSAMNRAQGGGGGTLSGPGSALEAIPWGSLANFALFGTILLLGVLALFQSNYARNYPYRNPFSVIGWIFSLVFPGSGRPWSFLGPAVLVTTICALVFHQTYVASNGIAIDPITAVGAPGVARSFGFGEVFLPPFAAALAKLGSLWWVIIIANLAYLLSLLIFRPEYDSARGKPAPEGPEETGEEDEPPRPDEFGETSRDPTSHGAGEPAADDGAEEKETDRDPLRDR